MRPVESFVGQSVRSLQTMLRVIAEDDRSQPSLIPDGIYSEQTKQAVSAFQRRKGLPATGVADNPTWDAVRAEFTNARIRVTEAQPLQLILNPGQVIRPGESHPYLYLIQVMLAALSEVHSSSPAPPTTGRLDLLTQQAVSEFQYLSGLEQTGAVDKITWKHLALQYPLAVNIKMTQNRTLKNNYEETENFQ